MAERVRSLVGVSKYAASTPTSGHELGDPMVERVRQALGGQLQPLATTQLRWFLADLETASRMADSGDMTLIGQLWRAMRRDGYISGLCETRTAGLVALPKRWSGNATLCAKLRADAGTSRSVFDEMAPPAELAALAADGLTCGVGVGELVEVVGRPYPRLVRLDPEFLRFRWTEQAWYYQSTAGLIRINPGDGRWVLHTAGGHIAPWQYGLWPALGRAFVHKEHALLHRGNYSGKLANPARVAKAANGATEQERLGFLAKLMAWGVNSVFELPPGWEAYLLESNGRGWEVFGAEIDSSNQEIMINLAGQFVTVTGGTGFANADIHDTIRADLIKRTGDGLAYTINTQILPAYAVNAAGGDALRDLPQMAWDIAAPTDRKLEAETMSAMAKGIRELRSILAEAGKKLDVDTLVNRFGIAIAEGAPDANALPQKPEAPSVAGAGKKAPNDNGKPEPE